MGNCVSLLKKFIRIYYPQKTINIQLISWKERNAHLLFRYFIIIYFLASNIHSFSLSQNLLLSNCICSPTRPYPLVCFYLHNSFSLLSLSHFSLFLFLSISISTLVIKASSSFTHFCPYHFSCILLLHFKTLSHCQPLTYPSLPTSVTRVDIFESFNDKLSYKSSPQMYEGLLGLPLKHPCRGSFWATL